MTAGCHEVAESASPLANYHSPDAFFATAEHTLLGVGTERTFAESTPEALADALGRGLGATEARIALGALPFDTAESLPNVLVAPKALQISGPARAVPGGRPALPVESLLRARSVPDRQCYLEMVAATARRIASSPLRKAVLARTLQLEFDTAVRVEPIVRNLVRDNPSGYTFALQLPHGGTFLGTSPELLLARHGPRVRSHPMAGSAPRSADPVRDKENAGNLLNSAKNRDEHAVVIEAVVDALRPFCRDLKVPREPGLVATPSLWHLGTPISGLLRDDDVTVLRLASALHPTPAVCGAPTDSARRLLAEMEPFDRGYYAGMVGWVNAEGDGEWAVSIRCAQVSGSSMTLFAGSGIVAASEPDAELDETSAKFRTLLQAMGLDLSL